VLLGGILALWFGFRWAIYGTGYWPQGWAGRLLFVSLLVIVPAAIVFLSRVFTVGIEKQRFWCGGTE
jgi:hypothetical protein